MNFENIKTVELDRNSLDSFAICSLNLQSNTLFIEYRCFAGSAGLVAEQHRSINDFVYTYDLKEKRLVESYSRGAFRIQALLAARERFDLL